MKLRILIAIAAILGAVAFYTTQPTYGAKAGGESPVSRDRLEAHVRFITAQPHDSTQHERLDAIASYITQQFQAAGITNVREQAFDQGIYRNIVATVGADTPDRIVVGAHYDACGPMPGADDNASGTAGLLELARLLAAHPPKRTVELVAYTNEEPPNWDTPLQGSVVHAASLSDGKVAVRAMLSLEMIGTFTDVAGSQSFPLPGLSLLYPTRGNFIAVVGDLGVPALTRKVKTALQSGSRLDVRSINGPSFVQGIDWSDHKSYRAHDYPAVMITDTAFFRNPRYHTADDTADMLDFTGMAEVVSGTALAVHALAD
jgi:Zn-dependent M28 family amino/carboxypeptidase